MKKWQADGRQQLIWLFQLTDQPVFYSTYVKAFDQLPISLTFTERLRVFGDARVTTALPDRLTHQPHILKNGHALCRFRHSLSDVQRASASASRQRKQRRHCINRESRIVLITKLHQQLF